MKKLTVLLLMFCCVAAVAQKSTDPQLNSRLQEYLAASRQLNFTKAMEFMHPRLFAIATKQQLIQTMEQAFSNPQMQIRFDSMAVVAISPAFQQGKESYRKIDYFMRMTISLNDSLDLRKKVLADAMQKSFSDGFPGKQVKIDPESNTIRVTGNELMFAIKGAEATQWMFLGYEKSNPQLVQRLYPEQVRRHFKLL